MEIWNWQPDWSVGMIERLQWRTDVLEAARGEEQRRSLRIDPRQFMEFTATASGSDRRILETLLWKHGGEACTVPLWFDGQELAAQLTSGSTVIPLNPAQRGYQVGEHVMLTRGDPKVCEVIEINALGSSITLDAPTAQTWPAGTRAYPARSAVIESQADVGRFTGNDSSIRILWRMLYPKTWAAAASPSYRSIPVLEQLPNWIEDPEFSYERKVSVFDGGVGLTVMNDQAEMPLTLQRLRYTLATRAQIDTWKQRLWALRGKQGNIWVPTWASDLSVVASISSVATTIDVAWTGYTDHLLDEPNRQDIRIELLDGTVFYRRITSSTEVSSTVERLTIDSALGATVALGQVGLVSFMGLSRSESDNHEFAYFTGDSADTAFSARGFRHDL